MFSFIEEKSIGAVRTPNLWVENRRIDIKVVPLSTFKDLIYFVSYLTNDE